MKLIFIIPALLFFFSAKAQQDTVKKYNLKLTETEYRALQNKLGEAAQYEAEIQRQKTLESFENFFKENIEMIKPKDTVGKK